MIRTWARLALSFVAALTTGIGSPAFADCDNPTPPLVINPEFPGQFAAGYSFDIRSDRLIVGDPYANPNPPGVRTTLGFAAIYERGTDGAWVRAATLAPDPAPPSTDSPRMGSATAIEGDVAVVAAEYSRFNGPNTTLYFYRRGMNAAGTHTWSKTGSWTYPPPMPATARPFVSGVCIAGDTVLVAFQNQDALTFTRDDTSPMGWTLDAETIPARAYGGVPTHAVAFDGRFAVFGEPTPFVGEPAPVVKVFERTPGGWILRDTLSGRNDDRNFGVSVSIDGDLIAVGSNHEPDAYAVGYVRLFRRTADGSWPLEAELEHPTIFDAPPKSGFGMAVSVRGNRVAVGSYKEDSAGLDSGAVHLFEKTSDHWQGISTYSLPNSDAAQLGMDVILLDDTLAAGAQGLDGVGGVVLFGRCSISGSPTDPTPRCLPGVLGLLSYIEAFFLNSPFADFNHSGAVTVQDLFDYLAAWFAGCP